MRQKVPLEVKMEALKLLQSGESVNALSKRYHIPAGELKTWMLIYAKEGECGLAAYPRNFCIGDIKDKIICTYRRKSHDGNEVDFILQSSRKLVAIEVKSGRRQNNQGLPMFSEQFHPDVE